MSRRKLWRFGARPLACLVLLTIGSGPGRPQPPELPRIPRINNDAPPIPLKPAGDPTVEELIGQLERLRKERADLERQEQAVVEQLRARLREQADRLGKLGIALPAPQPKAVDDGPDRAPPPRVVDGQVGAKGTPGQVEAARLVRRLGSPEFAEREGAERQLLALGPQARPAVRAGTRDPDAEIARRCEALLGRLRAAELAAFAAGTADWPGPEGKRFRDLVGDTRPARELFVEMMGDDRRAALVERAAADPAQAARLYAAEVARAQQAGQGVFETYTGHLAEPEVWAEYRDKSRAAVPPADVAAVLFLGSFPLPDGAADPARVEHVLRASFLDLAGGPTKEPFRKLFAAWLDRRRDPEAILAGLEAALYGSVPEAAPVARRLAADPKCPPRLLGAALTVLGHHGAQTDLAGLSALRDDDRVLRGGRAIDGLVYEVQVRDVAAAMSLLRRGHDPETFGFHTTRWVGHWFGPGRPPFDTVTEFTPDARAAALKQVWDWLDR